MTALPASEAPGGAPARRLADARVSRTLRVVLVGVLALQLAFGTLAAVTAVGAAPDRPEIVDFHAFVAVGRLALEGRLAEAYDATRLADIERAMGNHAVVLPFNYPPVFGLLLAPLALLPVGAAFALFAGATLALFVAVLRRLAGPWVWTALLAVAPAALIDLRIGQNGFLTAGLAGLSALLALRRRGAAAGLTAGVLLALKPHLALGLPLLFLLRRDWRALAAAAVAAAMLTAASLAASGPGTLPAFLAGLGQSGGFMAAGRFPLHRMVSVDAFLMAAGVSAALALLVHGVVACGALALAAATVARLRDPAAAAGLLLSVTLLLSPYLYDYDLVLLGVALALMLPALARVLPGRKLDALLVGCAVTGGLGLLAMLLMGVLPGTRMSLGGPVLLVGFVLVATALRRDARAVPVPPLSPAVPVP